MELRSTCGLGFGFISIRARVSVRVRVSVSVSVSVRVRVKVRVRVRTMFCASRVRVRFDPLHTAPCTSAEKCPDKHSSHAVAFSVCIARILPAGQGSQASLSDVAMDPPGQSLQSAT